MLCWRIAALPQQAQGTAGMLGTLACLAIDMPTSSSWSMSIAAECHAYQAPPNATLEAWLNSYPDNWMTRELVGLRSLYPPHRPLTAADLHLAKQRLHLFSAVLLLERPESSMALMRRLFGWQDTRWTEERAGSRHSSNATAELEGPVLQRILRLNQLDERLYEYAEVLHDHQLWRAASSWGGEDWGR